MYDGAVSLTKEGSSRLTVSFPYDPLRVSKVKAIEGYKRHPDKKHWSFPDSNGILHKILKV